MLDRAATRRGRVEQRLDLLVLLVGELPTLEEELHAVVLGRVVRRGDDDAEPLGEERDRGSREDAAEDGGTARRGNPASDRLLELGPRCTRVAADEDATAARPQRGSPPDALDEVRRQLLADDAADTIRSEVPPHGGGTYRQRTSTSVRLMPARYPAPA